MSAIPSVLRWREKGKQWGKRSKRPPVSQNWCFALSTHYIAWTNRGGKDRST